MQYTLAFTALLGLVAAIPNPAPQGVTASIAPAQTPSTCSPDYMSGMQFQIGIVNASTGVAKRAAAPQTTYAIPDGTNPNKVPGNDLILTLEGGFLKDFFGRTGYVASNGQLQFDAPVQDGALYTAGFSACPNGTLALDSAVWYECLSAPFYNLYDEAIAPYCKPIYLAIIPYNGAGATAVPTVTATMTPMSTMAYPTAVSQVADGQLQAATTVVPAVTQVADGQIQAPTGVAAVTQIADGQIQAPTGVPAVSQIADGQVQAPGNTTTLQPFNPNGAVSSRVSGAFLAFAAGLVGLGALL